MGTIKYLYLLIKGPCVSKEVLSARHFIMITLAKCPFVKRIRGDETWVVR